MVFIILHIPGSCYQHGIGVSSDLREAVRLYTIASDQGHAEAQCKLGWFLVYTACFSSFLSEY